MSSRFYFGDDSAPDSQTPTNYSDDEDTASLPFPKPLSRPSFLTADFEPHTFLASLSTSNRFQTLEDLQSELRELSATINKELVDLVNENYEEFISLGTDLRGGEEKVEEVRVGLLGFEKDVKGLRERILTRREEAQALIVQKREVRQDIGFGRGLLEIDERLTDLEYRTGLKERVSKIRSTNGQGEDEKKWSEEWDEDSTEESDEEYGDDNPVTGRARALVQSYLVTKTLVKRYDPAHPFLVAQKERMQRVQDKVRLEVETAVRGSDELTVKQKLIQMRVLMDE